MTFGMPSGISNDVQLLGYIRSNISSLIEELDGILMAQAPPARLENEGDQSSQYYDTLDLINARLKQVDHELGDVRELLSVLGYRLKYSLHTLTGVTSLGTESLTREYEMEVERFQELQRALIEVSKDQLRRYKALNEAKPFADDNNMTLTLTPEDQDNTRFLKEQALAQDIAFNELLVQKRQTDIDLIQREMRDLHDMMTDVEMLKDEQGQLIDHLQTAVEASSTRMRGAVVQLEETRERRNRFRIYYWTFLLIVLLIILIVIIGARKSL